MIKRLSVLLLALLCLTFSALAENRVIDEADLLDSDTEARLESEIAAIAQDYQFDVVLLLKNSIGGQTPKYYAADYYDYGGYGYHASKDGILFLLSLEERDYFTLATGSGIRIFTDYGTLQIEEDVVPYLSSGNYETAMERFVAHVRQYLEQAESGHPYDVSTTVELRSPLARTQSILPIVLILAAVISLIVAFSLKAQMKTVRRKQGASSYVRDGSFALTRVQDIYLYTTTQRRKIETNSGNGGHGGGSTTFRGSSGTSHSGHGGKF